MSAAGRTAATQQQQQKKAKKIAEDVSPSLRVDFRPDVADELPAAGDDSRLEKEDQLLGRLPALPIDWQVTYKDVYEALLRCRIEDGPGTTLKINEVCQVLRRFNAAFENARVPHLRHKVAPILYYGVYVTHEFVFAGTKFRFKMVEDLYQKKHVPPAEVAWLRRL